MLLKPLEKDYLRAVETLGARDVGGATLPAVAHYLGWSDKDFDTATYGLQHYGYILVTGTLVNLSPIGQIAIAD
jgi:hypothetical protein